MFLGDFCTQAKQLTVTGDVEQRGQRVLPFNMSSRRSGPDIEILPEEPTLQPSTLSANTAISAVLAHKARGNKLVSLGNFQSATVCYTDALISLPSEMVQPSHDQMAQDVKPLQCEDLGVASHVSHSSSILRHDDDAI